MAMAYRGSLWEYLWSALLRGFPTTIVMVLAEGGHEGSLLKPPIEGHGELYQIPNKATFKCREVILGIVGYPMIQRE